jgi:Ca2+-binding RTX toxin-like protein
VDLDGAIGDDGHDGEGDSVAADVESVTGGAGADFLIGNQLTNLLDGGPGPDRLDPAGASDEVYGGSGDDRIMLADVSPDYADCGSGADTVAAGSSDDTDGCEATATAATIFAIPHRR